MRKQQFHYDQSVSSIEFEHKIDTILTEINAYIPRFVIRTDTPDRYERSLIFCVTMGIISWLFSAWKFYKDRRLKQNLHRTLKYIINAQKEFKTAILNNKGNLLSLADFKDLKDDFHKLEGITSKKFDQYVTFILYSYADAGFYRNYLFFYANVIHELGHDLNLINNKIERVKTKLYIKCQNFVSGLHVLADNKIPESILHADMPANILLAIARELQHDNRYSLLYGSKVNAYYHMPLVRSFIINDALYMTIMLPLRHSDAPIL